MRNLILAILLIGFGPVLLGQSSDPINLVNPSFEDFPRQGHAPRGWFDCGFPEETPPDVQPSDITNSPFFKVSKRPQHGNTFLGMVVRDNDTWEKVSQRLSAPIEGGSCYEFSIYLSRSELYVSQSRSTHKETNYTTPARLRIWGGSSQCHKKELLGETTQVANTRWLKFNFSFEPSETHTHILLEAFYNTPVLFPYNGNILVDNASPIIPIPCDNEVPVAISEPPVPDPVAPRPDPVTEETAKGPTTTPPVTEPDPVVAEVAQEDKIIQELNRNTLREGQTIRIDQLFFEADSSKIKTESHRVLDELYSFLANNRDVVVEIGGHTNGIPEHAYCDRLSTLRAKAVAEYLVRRGIKQTRLKYKGYGKRQPVATNKTPNGRKRNQRVEIKILSLSG